MATDVTQAQAPLAQGYTAGEQRPVSVASRPQTRVSSESLFGGQREILIEHGSEAYRLRRTRLGKLILTK